MRRHRTRHVLKKWSGLQMRMTISYIGVTVVTVLLLQLLLGVVIFVILTQTPFVDFVLSSEANRAAQVYAQEAAKQAGKTALDPHSTFEPDQAFSLPVPEAPSAQSSPPSFIPVLGDLFKEKISYLGTRVPASQMPAFALLIAPNGQVLASSYPARYPASAPVAHELPGQIQLILNALAGRAASTVEHPSSWHVASAVQTVWSGQKRALGAVYVQVPLDVSDGFILSFLAGQWLNSGLYWLFITAPLGALFGLVTTRGLVQRIRRLATTTTQFAAGHFEQRLPAVAKDEVGQLEQAFNQMADQLVESMAQRQVLIEQQARQAERARIEQELRTAQHIQQSLLPKELPELAGWRLTRYYQPARVVGGDFYDVLPFADGQVGIVVGDVAGKGVPAALVMATTCTMLRTAAQATRSPGEVLARVNDLLSARIPPGMFVTCFFALFDTSSGRLHYANAGHEWPFRRSSGSVSELQATGMPLGMMPGTRYDEQAVMLLPGESLLLYSDGLVEAHNQQRDMFGLPHLKALIEGHPGGTELIDFLLGDLTAFTGEDWEQEDDVTLLLVQRESVPVEAAAGQESADGWRTLAVWNIPSEPGNERQAVAEVSQVVRPLGLSSDQVADLESAVAEAVMNAMEHGNHYQPDQPVSLQVRASQTAIMVRIGDTGSHRPLPVAGEVTVPDLMAKLAERQVPRGWGLFLIQHLVDEMHSSGDERHHVVDLVMYRETSGAVNQRPVEQSMLHARE